MTVIPRPVVAAPQVWAFPPASTTVLPNGLTVVTYDVPGQYVLSVRIGMPVPIRDEPRDKEGVATITARTLDEGTEKYTSEQFARMLERKGVSFGAGMSEAGMSLDLDVVKGNLEPALDLLRQILCEPAFPEAEVARHVRMRLAEIDQERAMPANRAALEFVRAYFAPGDRASRPTGGSRETVGAITRADVVAFHAAQVVAHGSTLVLAGDLSGLDAPAMVEQALGSWPAGVDERASHLSTPAEVAPDRCRVVIVDRPGSVQSEILVGCPGPDRSVEGGWAPHPVIGFVLGGSPNARIDAVLREEKGYTYGIRSSFRPRRSGGLFMTSGSVRAETTVESLRLLVDILESGSKGFSEKEIRSGVDFIGKTAPGRYATADAIADEAEMMALDGRTTEFTTANLRDLATVDVARVEQAWARFAEGAGLVEPGGGWTIVVVGDAAAFHDDVVALNLGPVAVVLDD